jgi:ABC-type lipoprotein release transport system permease subunit
MAMEVAMNHLWLDVRFALRQLRILAALPISLHALGASIVPAARAASIEPMQALRTE